MVTRHFLFSDIEGSSQLWETHPEEMRAALAIHDEQILRAVEGHEGVLLKNTGDGAAAVFKSATSALVAAADAQRSLRSRSTRSKKERVAVGHSAAS